MQLVHAELPELAAWLAVSGVTHPYLNDLSIVNGVLYARKFEE